MKVHKIEPRNYELRLTFTYWFKERGPQFCENVLFSDEKWWVLHPESNTQNSRIWATVKPSEYEESRYTGKQKVMSWCGLLGGEVIGPFWFIDQNGRFTNVNQNVYLDMLQTKMWPNLSKRRNLRHIWFMQDGATCHTTKKVIDWLMGSFDGRVISLKSPVVWPPQSPDLNPLDYFFWGYGLSFVERESPQTLDQLMDVIERFCGVLEKEDVLRGIQSFNKRLELCQQAEGGHFQHLLK